MKKSRFAVLITGLLLAVSLLGAVSFASAAEAEGLLYFVNCGAGETATATETALGLTASGGNGDKAYASGFGYTQAGTAGGAAAGMPFDSWVTDGAYRFDVDHAVRLAIGVKAGTATVTVNGAAGEAQTVTEDTVLTVSAEPDAGSVTVSVSGAPVAFIAVTEPDTKILLSAAATDTGVLIYGKPVEDTVKGWYSDGTTGDVAVEYTVLNTEELNQNFAMTSAAARLVGTNYTFNRTLLTMPDQLVYFVNAGSQTDPAEPELDDVYYRLNAAVANRFELLNETPDQEFTGSATWGYTPYRSTYRVSSKQMPVKDGDPYPPAFPFNTVRFSDGDLAIEYNFTLPDEADATYNVYLGTRSHWHGRKVTPSVNGEAQPQFNLDAVNRVQLYASIQPVSGKITVKVEGPASQDEGMIAFVAIQKANAETAVAATPNTPTYTGTLDLGQSEFVVGNVTAGSKIQVSDIERPYNLLFEGMAAAAGEYTVQMDAAKLEGISGVRVSAVTNGGASDYTPVYITDIVGFTATPSTTAWTADTVGITVAATAESGITSVVVEHNYLRETFPMDGSAQLSFTYAAAENGTYSITVYSKRAFYVGEVEIDNIDAEEATLTASVATSGWTAGKTAVRLVADTVADIVKFEVFSKGAKLSSAATMPEVYAADPGEYTFAVTTSSGKVASTTVTVTAEPSGFKTTAAGVSGGARYTIDAKDGREMRTVYAYRITDDKAERVTVTDGAFNVYETGDYAVLAVYTNGESELTTLHLQSVAPAAETPDKKGCGSAMSGASATAALLALVGCALALKRRVRVR